eukprot:scaffold31_cov263-Pinguiococcus_pyrenoidosus.AAC.7
MILPHALLAVHLRHDALAGPQLGDENVVMHGLHLPESLQLVPLRHPLEAVTVHVARVRRIRVAAPARVALVLLVLLGSRPAQHVHTKHRGVGVRHGVLVAAVHLRQVVRVQLDGHEAQAVRQHLVVDDAGVIQDVHLLDGHGRHLGQHDAPQRICQGHVGAHQVEHDALVDSALAASAGPRRSAPAARPPQCHTPGRDSSDRSFALQKALSCHRRLLKNERFALRMDCQDR